MVEQVARALARNFNSYHFDRGESDVGWEEHTNAARAAITAMREPTRDMCARGSWQRANERLMWQEMIDAALEEES